MSRTCAYRSFLTDDHPNFWLSSVYLVHVRSQPPGIKPPRPTPVMLFAAGQPFGAPALKGRMQWPRTRTALWGDPPVESGVVLELRNSALTGDFVSRALPRVWHGQQGARRPSRCRQANHSPSRSRSSRASCPLHESRGPRRTSTSSSGTIATSADLARDKRKRVGHRPTIGRHDGGGHSKLGRALWFWNRRIEGLRYRREHLLDLTWFGLVWFTIAVTC